MKQLKTEGVPWPPLYSSAWPSVAPLASIAAGFESPICELQFPFPQPRVPMVGKKTCGRFCGFVQDQARKQKEELERMLEENRRKVEEAQRREALEQQRREEERYRELEELQRQKEEAMRRKKQQEEEERANQLKLLGKNKTRPKVSFAIGFK